MGYEPLTLSIQPVEVPTATTPIEPVTESRVKVIRIGGTPERDETTHAEATPKTVADAPLSAADISPLVGELVKLLSLSGSSLIERVARKAKLPSHDVEQLEARAEIDSDKQVILTGAMSRILARRIKNVEALDWAAISVVFVGWTTNLGLCVREIRIIAEAQTTEKKES